MGCLFGHGSTISSARVRAHPDLEPAASLVLKGSDGMRLRPKHVGSALVGIAILLSSALAMRMTRAADHLDSAATRAAPAADIDDIYAWVPKAGRTAMVMTVGDTFVGPGSRFGAGIEYRFAIRNVVSRNGKLVPTASARDIVCLADDAKEQKVTCTTSTGATKSHVLGAPAACDQAADELCVWAGVRKDPGYVDLEAIDRAAGPDGGLDALMPDGGNDILEGSSVLAIVLDVDTAKVLGTRSFEAGAGETPTEVVAVAAETTRLQ